MLKSTIMDSEKRYSRRDVLRFTGRAVVASSALAALGGYWAGKSQPIDGQLSTSPTPDITAEPILGIPPFTDAQANEIAMQKGMAPDTFFNFSTKVLEKLSAFLGDSLHPIYPPSVLDHKKLIYDLAKEFSTPPNVIATIMTIESCGIKGAESYVGAQGLFQVMPFHFDESIQKNPQAMQEPYLNGRTGMKYFVNTCLPAARAGFPAGYPKDHVNVYARALMAYNAGTDGARVNFDKLPDETKFYGDHFIRFAMTADIADGLRKKENGDLDIVKKLFSIEMDARAYALQEFARKKGNYSYGEYLASLKEISLEVPGVDKKSQNFTENGEGFNRDYKEYLSNPIYVVPASPGLRIWLNLGGLGLFLRDPRNSNLKEWDKINSR